MNDLPYLLTALCAAVIFGFKLPALLRAPREARRTIRPVCFGSVCVCVQFFFVSPSVASYVNDLTGVTGLSRLIVNVFGIGLVCSAQVLVLNWRYERRRAQRIVRPVLAASCVVVALLCVLFWLGSGVEDGLREFPTSYTRSPFLAAFLIIYFCCYAVGVGSAVYLSWRGAGEVPEDNVWLRRAVRLTAVGMSFPVAYAVLSLVSVSAVWFGKDLGYLAVTVAPAVTMLGVPEFLAAITIASWGPRFSSILQRLSHWQASLRDYVALGPLSRALRPVDPSMKHSPRRFSERFSVEFRLFWRVVEINDWLEQLRRFSDAEVADVVARSAQTQRLSAEQVAAVVEAAQNKAALREHEQEWDDGGVDMGRDLNAVPENKSVFATERARLVSVAKALDSAARP